MLVCIIGLETVYMELTWLVFRAPGYFWGPWSHWDSGVYVRCWGMGMGWIPRNLFRGICPPLRILPLDRTFSLFPHSSSVLCFPFYSTALTLPQFGDYLKLFDIFQSGLKCKAKCKSVVFVQWQNCHSSSSSTAHNFLESVLQSLPKVPCHAYPSCLCAASQCLPHHCGETVSIT